MQAFTPVPPGLLKSSTKIPFSRQSVRSRAETFKDALADIQDENVDVAEEGLHTLMRSKNPTIQLKAIDLFLRAKGRVRGYGDRLDLTSGDKPLEPFTGKIPVVKATDQPNDASD